MDGTLKQSVLSRPFFRALAVFAILTAVGCGKDGASNYTSSAITEPGTETDMPASDSSRAIGFYTNGGLSNAVQLPDESFAHVKVFRLRDRAWGTRTLVQAIVNGTATFRRLFPYGDRVQVGDLGKRGGGYVSGHGSHQNGLDADFGYLQSNQVERNPNNSGANGFAEIFVKGGKVTRNFDTVRNWYLLKSIVQRNVVARIFVDPAIKKEFCNLSGQIDPNAPSAVRAEVLRRLRPYPNHADHFHLRVRCPSNANKCIAQEEPPRGSGCSSTRDVTGEEHQDEAV